MKSRALEITRTRRKRTSSFAIILDANMDAVILRQSEQLQTKTSTRPGLSVGCQGVSAIGEPIMSRNWEVFRLSKNLDKTRTMFIEAIEQVFYYVHEIKS